MKPVMTLAVPLLVATVQAIAKRPKTVVPAVAKVVATVAATMLQALQARAIRAAVPVVMSGHTTAVAVVANPVRVATTRVVAPEVVVLRPTNLQTG